MCAELFVKNLATLTISSLIFGPQMAKKKVVHGGWMHA